MRAEQPPTDPDQWLLPLAVDELGDALDVVRALTDEADATAVAARAALDDNPAYDETPAEATPEVAEDRGSGGETISPSPTNLDSPAGPAPAETAAQPAEAAEPATDERSADDAALPAAAMAAAVEAEPAAVVDEPAVEAEVEQQEPEPIRIGGTPAAAAASAAAVAVTADTSAAAPAAAPPTAAAPAPPAAGSGGGGGGRGDGRNGWLAAAFVGMIALAVAAVAVLLGTRSPSAKDVAGPPATPSASKPGSGFSMTLTAPPAPGGAKPSASAKPVAPRASAKPTPKPTVAGSQCSGSGWQQRRLQSAISRITYDYGRLGIRVAAAPAREGVLAVGDKPTRVVTAYVRSCGEESAPLLAASVADQMAQLIDLQVLTDSERVDWLRRRGFAGGTTWDPDGLLDYASVFTRWQVGSGFWRSSLAPPSAAELEILKRWYAPN